MAERRTASKKKIAHSITVCWQPTWPSRARTRDAWLPSMQPTPSQKFIEKLLVSSEEHLFAETRTFETRRHPEGMGTSLPITHEKRPAEAGLDFRMNARNSVAPGIEMDYLVTTKRNPSFCE